MQVSVVMEKLLQKINCSLDELGEIYYSLTYDEALDRADLRLR